MKAVEPVGTVPDAFQTIVDDNLFYEAVAYDDCLIKIKNTTGSDTVERYDYSGKLQLSYTKEQRELYSDGFNTSIPTADGGILATYSYTPIDDSTPIIEGTLFIKIAADGSVEWEKHYAQYSWLMLQSCVEQEDGYYFFGETDASVSDLHLLKLSKSGEIQAVKTIGGSDYDTFFACEENGSNFVLHCHIQSTDGDFFGIEDPREHKYSFIVTVDTELNLVSTEPRENLTTSILGFIDGNTVTAKDERFTSFDGGTIQSVLDYGEFYLVVSLNYTGIVENQPMYSGRRLCYAETVYTAYTGDGKLLWRAAADDELIVG